MGHSAPILLGVCFSGKALQGAGAPLFAPTGQAGGLANLREEHPGWATQMEACIISYDGLVAWVALWSGPGYMSRTPLFSPYRES